MLHLFEEYIYTNHSITTRNTRYGPVVRFDLQVVTAARVRTPVGKYSIEIFALIFLIPPRMHSHLAAGDSENMYTDRSQNHRIRYGTVVKHAYQTASTWVRHLMFIVVCAKPTPHFYIPEFLPRSQGHPRTILSQIPLTPMVILFLSTGVTLRQPSGWGCESIG